MPITPIDAKTNLVGNNESSRIRENQKTQEQGQSQLVTQNTQKEQAKFETVNNSEASENKHIRPEDQGGGDEKTPPDQHKKAKEEPEEEKEETPPIPDPTGRGKKIDLKA